MNTPRTAREWLDKHGAEASSQPLADALWAYGEQVREETYDAVLMDLDRFLSAAEARMGHTHTDDTAALRDVLLGSIDWIRAQRDRR